MYPFLRKQSKILRLLQHHIKEKLELVIQVSFGEWVQRECHYYECTANFSEDSLNEKQQKKIK